jgi:hypothetical protein
VCGASCTDSWSSHQCCGPKVVVSKLDSKRAFRESETSVVYGSSRISSRTLKCQMLVFFRQTLERRAEPPMIVPFCDTSGSSSTPERKGPQSVHILICREQGALYPRVGVHHLCVSFSLRQRCFFARDQSACLRTLQTDFLPNFASSVKRWIRVILF